MEALALESSLDKWYLDLPDHLRCELVDTGSSFSISLPSKQRKPLPNVLGLHMYYWTTVLVLHRSLWVARIYQLFLWHNVSIAHLLHRKGKSTDDEDPEIRTRFSRNYELCRSAAIRVASISESLCVSEQPMVCNILDILASLYQETYLFQRCSPLFIYCLFSSSILLDCDSGYHWQYFWLIYLTSQKQWRDTRVIHKLVYHSPSASMDSMQWALFGHQLGGLCPFLQVPKQVSWITVWSNSLAHPRQERRASELLKMNWKILLIDLPSVQFIVLVAIHLLVTSGKYHYSLPNRIVSPVL